MLSMVQRCQKKKKKPATAMRKGFLLGSPDLKSSFSANQGWFPLEPRTHFPKALLEIAAQPKVFLWPSFFSGHIFFEFIPSGKLDPGRKRCGGDLSGPCCRAPTREAGVMQNIPLHSTRGGTHPCMKPPNRGRPQMSR